MANQIPGVPQRTQPRAFVRTKTQSRSISGNAGTRLLCIVGEGEGEEVLVDSALGSGDDGLNPDFSGRNSPDGRHFQISKTRLISNRVSLLKNGIPLRTLEDTISVDPFDARYDARVEPATGRVELQRSYLVARGSDGSETDYYSAQTSNTGNGNPVLTTASLVDTSAPAENWTLRCVGVIRDGYGNPISGQAQFSLSGSVSGIIKDANGTAIRWRSNGVVVSNNTLSFAVVEGSVPFEVGDRFSVRVASGVLARGDTLSARYIAEQDLYDPEIFDNANALFAKHGQPNTSNALSLASQMAFENGAPRILALQPRPPVPRRTSAVLMAQDNPLTDVVTGATGGSTEGDSVFAFPLGARPGPDTEVNIFVVDPSGAEQQIGPLSKADFYGSDATTAFGALSQGSYTVVLGEEVEATGLDGYVETLSTTEIRFTSPTARFTSDNLDLSEDDIDKILEILSGGDIVARYEILTIGDGYGDNTTVTAERVVGTHVDGPGYADVQWRIVDPQDESAYLVLAAADVANQLTEGKGLRVTYVDIKDSAFFDTNWLAALEALETVSLQILVLVPSATISSVFQAARAHCEAMSNIVNARERNLIIGAINGLTPENLIGRKLAAVENIGVLEGIQGDDVEEVLAGNIEDLADYSVTNAYGNTFRVVYMGPDQIVRTINGTNTTLPGFYMAPCLGGLLAGQTDFSQPATFKTLVGFNILRDRQYRQVILDELADAGVTVVQPVPGGGRILHGLTTTQSGAPEEEEISIVYIRDAAANALRNTVTPFIGTVSGPTTIPALTSSVKNTLEALVSQGLLTGFANLSVRRNPSEPRQFDITVTIAPSTPINWIFVDVSVTI